jgi:hypothetical protein
MRWYSAVLHEVLGLFVDDGSFALAILVWLAIARWAFPRFGFANRWGGVILFAGLGFIIVESATRFSRRSRMQKRARTAGN